MMALLRNIWANGKTDFGGLATGLLPAAGRIKLLLNCKY